MNTNLKASLEYIKRGQNLPKIQAKRKLAEREYDILDELCTNSALVAHPAKDRHLLSSDQGKANDTSDLQEVYRGLDCVVYGIEDKFNL